MARKKYFKHGDPTMGTWFSVEMYESMTEDQKADWTPSDEVEDNPVPGEVTEFMKKPSIKLDTDKDLVNAKAEIGRLEAFLGEKFPEKSIHAKEFIGNPVDLAISLLTDPCCKDKKLPEPKIAENPEELLDPFKGKSPEEKKKFYQEELTKAGIKFNHNLGLPKLEILYNKTFQSKK